MTTIKPSCDFKPHHVINHLQKSLKLSPIICVYLCASVFHLWLKSNLNPFPKNLISNSLFLGLLIALTGGRANALPGQTTQEVAAWIQANPNLQPTSGETLLVRKSDTAAQRFTFEASALAPGRATIVPLGNSSVIRAERLELFDLINGITVNRLEESLRVIYGLDIYQDYQRARVVYAYPNPETVNLARSQNEPLLEALQGELRLGDRYAYWIEIAQPRQPDPITGKVTPIIGRIVVFLKEDLDKLESELRNR